MFNNSFSFKGRNRRTEYGISLIICVLIFLVINAIIASNNKLAPVFIIYIPLLWFLWAQGAKRCHDRGNSGWFQIIPFYVFWMIFADSNDGINKYGLNPKGLGNSNQSEIVQKENIIIPPANKESELKPDVQLKERNSTNTPTLQVIPGSASIKIILDDIKWVIGLKSITFLLDGQPLKPIPLGGSGIFEVNPGKHTIQTILKAGSFFTFFIIFSRRSTLLTLNFAPNAQLTVMAIYNRTWGNIDLKPTADALS